MYLMLVLKIPIALLLYLVWWAVHQVPDDETEQQRRRRRQHGVARIRAGPLPRSPRRGPHGGSAPAPPRADAQRRRPGAARQPRLAVVQNPLVAESRPPRGALPPGLRARLAAMSPTSVLSDGTIRRLVEDGRIVIEPWDETMVQPRQRRPAARRLVPRLPQPPRHGDRPARAAERPHRAGRRRGRRAVRHPPRRVLPRPHRGVGRAARRHRRADRGQVLARAARADRPRDRRLLRPGLEGHADAGAQQPHARADQALARAADRAALVHDARPARRSGPTATRSSAATTTARSRRPSRGSTPAIARAAPRWRPAERSGSFRAHGERVPGARRRRGGEERDALLRRSAALFAAWAILVGTLGMRSETFPQGPRRDHRRDRRVGHAGRRHDGVASSTSPADP